MSAKGKAATRSIYDYLGCVKAVDENVGRALDYLDDHDLSENKLVIYTSDQGMFLGEHDYFDKRWIYEECLRMPFLARLPGSIPAGSVNDQELCSNLDFAQTLLDYANCSDVKQIDEMQGSSLRGILSGKTPDKWRTRFTIAIGCKAHHHIPAHYGCGQIVTN